jgi:hypothetical protein
MVGGTPEGITIWCKRETPWSLKARYSLHTCCKIRGFGGSPIFLESHTKKMLEITEHRVGGRYGDGFERIWGHFESGWFLMQAWYLVPCWQQQNYEGGCMASDFVVDHFGDRLIFDQKRYRNSLQNCWISVQSLLKSSSGCFGRTLGHQSVQRPQKMRLWTLCFLDLPKSVIFTQNQYKVWKSDDQERFQEKHEIVLKIRYENENPWEAKVRFSLHACCN